MTSRLVGHGDPTAYLSFPSLTALGVPNATTTRHCPGVTSFAEPIVPQAPRPPFRAEASVVLGAAGRGVPLAIFTADCLAIVLYDPSAPALAVAHVGWRGTVRGATQAAVKAIARLGGTAGSLRAAIAPSIGPCCYEVDEPVTAEFARAFGERWRAWVEPSRAGRVMLDLWSANEA